MRKKTSDKEREKKFNNKLKRTLVTNKHKALSTTTPI